MAGGTTPNENLPYPSIDDQNNPPADIQALAAAADISFGKKLPRTGRRATRSNTSPIPDSTPTAIGSWPDGIDYAAGNVTYGAGVYTVTLAGLYLVSATVQFATTNQTGRCSLSFLVNGAAMQYASGSTEQVPLNGGFRATAIGLVPLAVGGTVQLQIYQTSGTTMTVTPTSFAIALVA